MAISVAVAPIGTPVEALLVEDVPVEAGFLSLSTGPEVTLPVPDRFALAISPASPCLQVLPLAFALLERA